MDAKAGFEAGKKSFFAVQKIYSGASCKFSLDFKLFQYFFLKKPYGKEEEKVYVPKKCKLL